MDIGKQRRIIQVEPEPLSVPTESRPMEEPAPEFVPVQLPEPERVPAK